MGDFNAKIGKKDKHPDTQSMGLFGTGEKNVRFGKNRKGKPNEKLEEDLEKEGLDEKRKTLKKREAKTTAENIEYIELNKVVKKKRRARQRRKRKEEIEKIIVNGIGPKEAYKGGARKNISCMIKENRESTTDRDEIITICRTFYRELCEQTTPDQPTTLTSSTDKEEIPSFLEEEVKETLNEMKKKKTPGNDGTTSDVMKIGGPQVIKYMTKVYNEILKSKEIPICWKEAKVIRQVTRKT
ncbi:endonuclease-reverse transcriptase [Plakobranchus ocellatus]|uniref:Endonuclease-reverse transcriptase n=1 Tax=Plakobranchus ocellatus TaxID=259542 RepID=A0AAV3YAJ4_9GAST|nr:endonuclease-reverse transcriptase [Plakobranchus ocellatus]